jgi:hypothetical protein
VTAGGGRGRLAFVLALLGTMLALVPAAGAKTIPLGWTETHTAYGKHVVVAFTVSSLVIEPGGWRLHLSIHNDTNVRLLARNRIALVAFPSPGDRRAVLTLPARSATPGLPRVLGIQARWRGVVAGRGTPPPGTYVRVRFAELRVALAPNLVVRRLSRHGVRLPAR